MSRAQAAPVFAALNEPLPAAGEWTRWIAAADAATRSRVQAGDDLSIVNLLLFGTSFTAQPRMTSGQLNPKQIMPAVDARLRDFERALAGTDANERLQIARRRSVRWATREGAAPVHHRSRHQGQRGPCTAD